MSNIEDAFWSYRFWWVTHIGPDTVYRSYGVTEGNDFYEELLVESFDEHINTMSNKELIEALIQGEQSE